MELLPLPTIRSFHSLVNFYIIHKPKKYRRENDTALAVCLQNFTDWYNCVMERIPVTAVEAGVPSEELREKAAILGSINCGVVPRAELVLVLSGLKPATNLSLFKNNENPESVKKKISDAGLVYKEVDEELIKNPNLVCLLGVARNIADATCVAELLLTSPPDDDDKFGQLMGFPQTAIDAFAKRRESFADDKRSSLFQERGLPFRFRLSKDNWEEEIKVAEVWTAEIKEIAPELYRELMSNEYLFPVSEKKR